MLRSIWKLLCRCTIWFLERLTLPDSLAPPFFKPHLQKRTNLSSNSLMLGFYVTNAIVASLINWILPIWPGLCQIFQLEKAVMLCKVVVVHHITSRAQVLLRNWSNDGSSGGAALGLLWRWADCSSGGAAPLQLPASCCLYNLQPAACNLQPAACTRLQTCPLKLPVQCTGINAVYRTRSSKMNVAPWLR